MSRIEDLKALIDSEPANATRTDQEVLDWLFEIVPEQEPRTSMSGDEVFSATHGPDWNGLTQGNKNLWLSFCGRETIDPSGSANVALVRDLFGNGSQTLSNLADIRFARVNRVRAAGLSTKNLGLSLVNRARAL